MPKFRVTDDEWYPVYVIVDGEPNPYDMTVELTDAEVTRYREARVEHRAVQKMIRERMHGG